MRAFHGAGHIGPASSSAFGAPALRFGRFAVTPPVRRGYWLSWSLLRKVGFWPTFVS
jgi:hypothetical protein